MFYKEISAIKLKRNGTIKIAPLCNPRIVYLPNSNQELANIIRWKANNTNFIMGGSNWQNFNHVLDFIIIKRKIMRYFVLPGVSQFGKYRMPSFKIFYPNTEHEWIHASGSDFLFMETIDERNTLKDTMKMQLVKIRTWKLHRTNDLCFLRNWEKMYKVE